MGKWIVALAVSAATTAAFAQGQSVRVVKDQSIVSKCTPIKEVRASNMFAVLNPAGAYDDVLNSMKSQSLEAGGNHLFLLDISTAMGTTNGLGEAYRCP